MNDLFAGVWLLVSQYNRYPDGRKEPSRGEDPAGVLVYDRNGHMAVQLMRTDERAGEYTDLASLRTALEGYLAYFGRYEVDAAQQIVRHYIAGASYLLYRGSVQIRRYTFASDTLTLEASSPLDDSTRILLWRRSS